MSDAKAAKETSGVNWSKFDSKWIKGIKSQTKKELRDKRAAEALKTKAAVELFIMKAMEAAARSTTQGIHEIVLNTTLTDQALESIVAEMKMNGKHNVELGFTRYWEDEELQVDRYVVLEL